MKRMVSGIMLTLLSIGMLTLAFNIQPVKASGTIYIRADGSVEPEGTPISSIDNITYTFTDDIYDSIVVERSNIIVDGNGYTLQGSGWYEYKKGFSMSGINNVTIKNLKIKSFYEGICLGPSSNNSISGNTITNSSEGIHLLDSSSNTISGNNITANWGSGIWLEFSPNNNNIYENNITANYGPGIILYESTNNSISGNTITNNTYNDGISISRSSNNTVSGNTITNNSGGISLGSYSKYNSISGNNITANYWHGIYLGYSSNNSISGNTFVGDGLFVYIASYGNVVEDNTVNGKPLVYLEDVSHQSVAEAGQVILVNCEYIQVQNLNLSHTTVGLELFKTKNTLISGNTITVNNRYGIYLGSSSNNSISGNNITNNTYGIDLGLSSNNSIYGNNIKANNEYGIRLMDSSNNTISGNNITNNYEGIYLWGSSNNTISGNNIKANNEYGIRLRSSSNNTIFHNNFIGNTQQVYIEFDGANFWDDGYPSGGNFWSDYTGVDKYSGPNQDELSNDGIGDTPYVIDENNTDHYPLMVPWGTPYGYYDWPMFRHDLRHTGYSASTAPNTNSTIWSYTTGGGVYSSPAVADDRVYVGSHDSKVYCLDAATGAHIWNYTTGGPLKFSSPAVADGKVYVGSFDRKVYCLNATSGDHIWNYTTGHMVLSSPAVAGGKVYVGSFDRKVYCLNATSGDHIWNYTTGSAVWSSPAVACGKVYVGSSDNKTYAFGLFHDVAVVNVTTSKCGCPGVGNGDPYPVLCQGRTAKVYVTVENQGNILETFNVTAYANDIIIETYTVTNLSPGSQETVTIIWNATGWMKGNYTIKAIAEQVPDEIHTGDNTFIDKWVMVVHPGDLDNSGEVDITDVVMVTGIYRAKIGDPDYNACRDVVEDGEIDIADVVAVTAHYREKDP